MTTATLLTLLLALPAQAADDDPEPPMKKGIVARLVAKKSTYKLDLGGKTADDYAAEAKKGNVNPPRVDLALMITNYTSSPVRIRTVGSTNRLTLALKGDGAVEAPTNPTVGKFKTSYQVLNPKEKLTIPIDQLSSTGRGKGKAGAANLYWTMPGEYKLSASYYTLIVEHFGTNGAVSR